MTEIPASSGVPGVPEVVIHDWPQNAWAFATVVVFALLVWAIKRQQGVDKHLGVIANQVTTGTPGDPSLRDDVDATNRGLDIANRGLVAVKGEIDVIGQQISNLVVQMGRIEVMVRSQGDRIFAVDKAISDERIDRHNMGAELRTSVTEVRSRVIRDSSICDTNGINNKGATPH